MLYLYSWDGTSLKGAAIFDKNRSAVTAIAFSSDGEWLAAGESSDKMLTFSDEGSGLQVGRQSALDTGFSHPISQPKPALFQSRFQSHSARINAPSNE